MNFLVLGDIFPSALNLLKKKLPIIKRKHKIDFIIANGENSAPDALGITKKAAKFLFKIGVDVITSGDHIWDKKEIFKFIKYENRLIRPANMSKKMPGVGYNIFKKKNKKICVINLMTNKFMPKSQNVFKIAHSLSKKFKMTKNVDFIIIDIHGEYAAEKKSIGYLYDGKATLVFGTHTHIPSADSIVLPKGTAYQTDLGMCGDYNSVIGLNKNIFLKKMLNPKNTSSNSPASGVSSICGAIVSAKNVSGLASNIKQTIIGNYTKAKTIKS